MLSIVVSFRKRHFPILLDTFHPIIHGIAQSLSQGSGQNKNLNLFDRRQREGGGRAGAGLEPDYSESYNCWVYDRSVWNYHLAIERRHATGTCGVAWRAAAAAGSEHNNDGNQVQTFLLNLVSVPRWCCQFNLQNEEASCYQ